MPTASQERDWDDRYLPEHDVRFPSTFDIDDEWKTISKIGGADGGFHGGIELVENKTSKQLAIRKRLCRHKDGDRFDYLQWRREISILRKLSHKNIVHYIDAFYTDVRGSIYMEPCRLGNVAKFASQKKHLVKPELQEYFLWYILHEVAAAVLYMQTGFQTLEEANKSKSKYVSHWVTIVHADIRPDQIFLHSSLADGRPQVRLGDFGFGQCIRPWKHTERHDGPGGKQSSKGPEFPEEISEATDVFGLGASAVMYILPRGKVSHGLKPGRLADAGISAHLEKIVCDCLATSPADRPNILDVVRSLREGLQAHINAGYRLKMLTGPLFSTLYPAR